MLFDIPTEDYKLEDRNLVLKKIEKKIRKIKKNKLEINKMRNVFWK